MTTSLRGRRRPPPWRGPIPLGTELAHIRATGGHPAPLVAKLALLPVALLTTVEESPSANKYLSERERIAGVLAALAGEMHP